MIVKEDDHEKNTIKSSHKSYQELTYKNLLSNLAGRVSMTCNQSEVIIAH